MTLKFNIIFLSKYMDKITAIQNRLFTYFIIISYVLYFLFAVGISTNAPKYLAYLDYFVKIYISLFLIWRFNMFRKIHFNELDQKIAFSAGVFLFATTALNEFLTNYFSEIRTKLSKR